MRFPEVEQVCFETTQLVALRYLSTSQNWSSNMKTMYAVYEREARKQLALAYVDALRDRVSRFEARILEGEANSGYEFHAVESAVDTANTYGFELPESLHERARELYLSEGCSPERFERMLADRPSLRAAG